MISNTIKELRKQRGWSQQMLATKLHVSGKTVANWEADVYSLRWKTLLN